MRLFEVFHNPPMSDTTFREKVRIQTWIWQADFYRWRQDGVWRSLAWMVPRRLVYWCGIRLASQPRYSRTHPDAIGIMDALKKWDAVTDGKQTEN
jgi:hypothetical protein